MDRRDISEASGAAERYRAAREEMEEREAKAALATAEQHLARMAEVVERAIRSRDEWHRKAVEAMACPGAAGDGRPTIDREAVARALWEAFPRSFPGRNPIYTWGDVEGPIKENWRCLADAVIAAVGGIPAPAAFPPIQTIVVHPAARSDCGPFTLHLFEADADADRFHTDHGGWIQIVNEIEYHPAARPAGEEAADG